MTPQLNAKITKGHLELPFCTAVKRDDNERKFGAASWIGQFEATITSRN